MGPGWTRGQCRLWRHPRQGQPLPTAPQGHRVRPPALCPSPDLVPDAPSGCQRPTGWLRARSRGQTGTALPERPNTRLSGPLPASRERNPSSAQAWPRAPTSRPLRPRGEPASSPAPWGPFASHHSGHPPRRGREALAELCTWKWLGRTGLAGRGASPRPRAPGRLRCDSRLSCRHTTLPSSTLCALRWVWKQDVL